MPLFQKSWQTKAACRPKWGALGNDRAVIPHLRGAAASGSAACLTFGLEVLSTGFKEDVEERCSRWKMFTGSSSYGPGATGQKGTSLGNWTDAGWHQYVIGGQRGCADNEGKRRGEVIENGDKGSVSAQGRREQMKEPDSFQWSPATGQGATGTNWNTGYSIST